MTATLAPSDRHELLRAVDSYAPELRTPETRARCRSDRLTQSFHAGNSRPGYEGTRRASSSKEPSRKASFVSQAKVQTHERKNNPKRNDGS
jgi:hypothetical protein